MKHSTILSFNTLTTIAFAITLAVLGSWFLYNVSPVSNPISASAGTTDNLSGYGWIGTYNDSNGNGLRDANEPSIGWVSFNCTNDSSCATSNYGVHIDESNKFVAGGTGNLTGHAWIGQYDATALGAGNKATFGWVDFSPSGPYPATGPNYSARIDWATGNISGWARVISGCQGVPGTAASSCSGVGPGAAAGGWDGWIKLRSTSGEPSYGARLTGSNNITGYGWGGSGIGWVSFSGSNYGVVFNPIATPPPAGCGTANGVPAVNAPVTDLCSNGAAPTSGPSSSAPATPYKWTWTCANPPSPDVTCTAPFTQCSDGVDNDGDGQIDSLDSGCNGSSGYNASDNTERNFQFREF